MNIDSVIAYFGSQAKVVKALGLKSHASLWHYRRSGIPIPRQCQIEILTGGKLKAERPPQ